MSVSIVLLEGVWSVLDSRLSFSTSFFARWGKFFVWFPKRPIGEIKRIYGMEIAPIWVKGIWQAIIGSNELAPKTVDINRVIIYDRVSQVHTDLGL